MVGNTRILTYKIAHGTGILRLQLLKNLKVHHHARVAVTEDMAMSDGWQESRKPNEQKEEDERRRNATPDHHSRRHQSSTGCVQITQKSNNAMRWRTPRGAQERKKRKATKGRNGRAGGRARLCQSMVGENAHLILCADECTLITLGSSTCLPRVLWPSATVQTIQAPFILQESGRQRATSPLRNNFPECPAHQPR